MTIVWTHENKYLKTDWRQYNAPISKPKAAIGENITGRQ